jgi:hypothetical protein
MEAPTLVAVSVAERSLSSALIELININDTHDISRLNNFIRRVFDGSPGSSTKALGPLRAMLEHLLPIYRGWYPWGLELCQNAYDLIPKGCIVHHETHSHYCTNCSRPAAFTCQCGLNVFYCHQNCQDALYNEHKYFCIGSEEYANHIENGLTKIDCQAARDIFFKKFRHNIDFSNSVLCNSPEDAHSRVLVNLLTLKIRVMNHLSDQPKSDVLAIINDCEQFLKNQGDRRNILIEFARTKLDLLTYLFTIVHLWGSSLLHNIMANYLFATDISGEEIFGEHPVTGEWDNFNNLLKHKICIPAAYRNLYWMFYKLYTWFHDREDHIYSYIYNAILQVGNISHYERYLRVFLVRYFDYIYYVGTYIYQSPENKELSDLFSEIIREVITILPPLEIRTPIGERLCIICQAPTQKCCKCSLYAYICSGTCMNLFQGVHKKHCKAAAKIVGTLHGSPSVMEMIFKAESQAQ